MRENHLVMSVDDFNDIRDEELMQKQIAFTSYLMEIIFNDDKCFG